LGQNPDIARVMYPDEQQKLGSFVDTKAASDYVVRTAASNIERMARQIGDGTRRRTGTDGRVFSVNLLPARVQGHLRAKKQNPRYYFPKDVYGDLLGYYRRYRLGAGSFNEWLQMVLGML
jgi:hypothetical protein